MPIMITCGLDQAAGKANWDNMGQYIIKHITKHNLQAQIVNGSHIGTMVLIPRIKLISNDTSYPFQLSRRQFLSVQPFAMTINKAPGQTLQPMELYLPKPMVFHGQLYVALSREGSKDKLWIFVVDGRHEELECVRCTCKSWLFTH